MTIDMKFISSRLLFLPFLFLSFFVSGSAFAGLEIRDGIAYVTWQADAGGGVRTLHAARYDLREKRVVSEVSYPQVGWTDTEYVCEWGVVTLSNNGVCTLWRWNGEEQLLLDPSTDIEAPTEYSSDSYTFSEKWMVGIIRYDVTENYQFPKRYVEINLETGSRSVFENGFPDGRADFAANPNWNGSYLAGVREGLTLWNIDSSGRVVGPPRQMSTPFTESAGIQKFQEAYVSPNGNFVWAGYGNWFSFPDLQYRGEIGQLDPPVMTMDRIYVSSSGGEWSVYDYDSRYLGSFQIPESPVVDSNSGTLIALDDRIYALYFRGRDYYDALPWELQLVPIDDPLLVEREGADRDFSMINVERASPSQWHSTYTMADGRILFIQGNSSPYTFMFYDPKIHGVVDMFKIRVESGVMNGIVFDASEESVLFALNQANIYRVDLITGDCYLLISFLNEIDGVGILPSGDIVVAEIDSLLRFGSDGRFLERVAVSNESAPNIYHVGLFGGLSQSADGTIFKVGNRNGFFSLNPDGSLRVRTRDEVNLAEFSNPLEGRSQYDGLRLSAVPRDAVEKRYQVVDEWGNLKFILPEFDDDEAWQEPSVYQTLWTEDWLYFIDSEDEPHLLETNNFTEVPIARPEIAPKPGQIGVAEDGQWIWFKFDYYERYFGSIVPYTIEDLIGVDPVVVDALGGRLREMGWSYTSTMRWYAVTDGPWIYHPVLQWIYAVGASDRSAYIYSPSIGWYFWNEDYYPTIYSYERGDWLYYQKWSNAPSWYYSWNSGYWVDDLPGPAPATLDGRELVISYPDSLPEYWGIQYNRVLKCLMLYVRISDDESDQEINLKSIVNGFQYARISDNTAGFESTIDVLGYPFDVTAELIFDSETSGTISLYGVLYDSTRKTVITTSEDNGVFEIYGFEEP